MIAAIGQLNSGVNIPLCADHFQVQSCLTITVGNIDSAGHKRTKIFHLADVLLQHFIVAKIGARRFSGFTVPNRVKHKPEDPADEQRDYQGQHGEDSGNDQDDFLCAHLKYNLAK